jgi:hypothetical protein
MKDQRSFLLTEVQVRGALDALDYMLTGALEREEDRKALEALAKRLRNALGNWAWDRHLNDAFQRIALRDAIDALAQAQDREREGAGQHRDQDHHGR